MSELARCRSERCGREILWCSIYGRPVPLDPVPVPMVGAGLVAYHAASGRGMPEPDVDEVYLARDDVTMHTRHHATCPGVAEFSVNREQGSLW